MNGSMPTVIEMRSNKRRHESLVPLTHDHHLALAQATSLCNVKLHASTGLGKVAEQFLRFYSEHMVAHFRTEEEKLFPLLLEPEGDVPEVVTALLNEHIRIHGMAAKIRAGELEGGKVLLELGQLIRDHIRCEEKVLFPLIERTVAEDKLNALSTVKELEP